MDITSNTAINALRDNKPIDTDINTQTPSKRQSTIEKEDAIYLLSEQGYTDDQIANILKSERTWINKMKKAAQRRWNPVKLIDRKFGTLARKRAHSILKDGSDSAAATLINRYLDQTQPKTSISLSRSESSVTVTHKIDMTEYQDEDVVAETRVKTGPDMVINGEKGEI